MALRRSIRVTLVSVGLAAIATLDPLSARAQEWTTSAAVGTASPVRPTNSLVTTGGHIALGVSHQAARSPLAFGAEIDGATFSETRFDYVDVYPCTPPGCAARRSSTTNLTLANYLATAKYALGSGITHPYVAIAAGLAQRLTSGRWNGESFGHAFSSAERAGVGVESHVGTLGVGLDVSYVAEGFTYEDHPVRYVPVTLRLTF